MAGIDLTALGITGNNTEATSQAHPTTSAITGHQDTHAQLAALIPGLNTSLLKESEDKKPNLSSDANVGSHHGNVPKSLFNPSNDMA